MGRFLFAAVVSALLALAQQPDNAGNLAILEGHVNDLNGQPVRKAGLTLRSPQSVYNATSDAQGVFSFRDIKPGGYTLSVDRTGYLRKLYRNSPRETMSTMALNAGQRLSGIDLTLARAAAISGRVLDEDGDPVAKVQVRLFQRTVDSGPNLMAGRFVNTDDRGRYEIPDLPPGRYYLSAGAGYGRVFSVVGMQITGGMQVTGDLRATDSPEYYVNTFYPSGKDQTEAKAVQVLHDDVQGIDIHLLKTRAFRVSGRLGGFTPSHPLEEYRIVLTPVNSPLTMGFESEGAFTQLAKDGSFDFMGTSFPPGDYFIMATLSSRPRRMVLVRQRLTIGDRDIDNAVLNFEPPVELHGKMAIEGEPQTDFSKFPGANLPPTVTTQVDFSLVNGPQLSDILSKIGGDGSFTMAEVPPGEYQVRVIGVPSGTWVKSIRLGSREAQQGRIEVTGASSADPLQITLSRSMGRIAGVVETDRGTPAGGTIVVFSEPPGTGSMVSGVQENGQFFLPQLAPGTYRLYAFEDLETAQGRDPELLEAYESKSVRVTVKENGLEQVTLRLIPAAP